MKMVKVIIILGHWNIVKEAKFVKQKLLGGGGGRVQILLLINEAKWQ
jgi:hypothetical protein